VNNEQNDIEERLQKHIDAADEAKRKKAEAANGKAKSEKSDDTQAQQLTKISTAAGLFHAPDRTGYADISVNGHRETWAIRSKAFKQWLAREFYRRDGAVPSATAMQSALALIEARALFDGEERKVFIRVGNHDGKQYLDLADAGWNAIEIDAKGWRLVSEPPLRFRRAPGMLPLPIPERGGKIERLRPFLNVKTDDDFVLAVAWLLAALRDRGPYPVLALSGVQGAAKSTFTAMLRSLVDPNTAPLRALARNDHDLFIAANNSHVIAFDNVSGLPVWLSDTLCRLATGGGFAVRQLYTDQDEMLFDACRPIITNGIEDFITRNDLASRSLFLSLQEIPERKRKEEQRLWAEFERERAKILGALLTAISRGLRDLPNVKPNRLPRMADFAKWGIACEPALWSAGTFMRAYDANQQEAVEVVIESDAVATALRSFMATRTEWHGTATELLSHLTTLANVGEVRDNAWPKAPHRLTGKLRRQETFLRQIGITIEQRRSDKMGTRMLYITRREEVGKGPSEPSEASDGGNSTYSANDLGSDASSDASQGSDASSNEASERNPLKPKASDATDTSDASLHPSYPCAHCGQPGGQPWTWLGQKVPLHSHCTDAYAEAQRNRRLRVVGGSSQ
jgi:hypothetical protein